MSSSDILVCSCTKISSLYFREYVVLEQMQTRNEKLSHSQNVPCSVYVPMKLQVCLMYQGLIVVIQACFTLLTALTKDSYFSMKSE